MNTKEVRKKAAACSLKYQQHQQQHQELLEAALDELDRVKAEVAELVGGEAEQFPNNVKAARSKLRNYDELEAGAKKLGYASAAKLQDAHSRLKPEKLVAEKLPHYFRRPSPAWARTFKLTVTQVNSYHRHVLKAVKELVDGDPTYFQELDVEGLDEWHERYLLQHPEVFLQTVQDESTGVLDPVGAQKLEAAENQDRKDNPTRGELHRLLERHFKPLFGRESDWELVKAHDDERYFAAHLADDLEARLAVGGSQSQYEAVAFLAPTLFALAGFEGNEYVELQYNGELPQGAALLEQLRKELPTTKEGWLTSVQNELLTY